MSNITDILDQYAIEKIAEMKEILIANGKGDSNIINNLNYEIDEGGLRLNFLMPDYANFVDTGRAPGKMPPMDAISEWTARKGIPSEANFPIARSIGLNGIPPTNFLDVFDDKSQLYSDLAKAGAADVVVKLKKLKL